MVLSRKKCEVDLPVVKKKCEVPERISKARPNNWTSSTVAEVRENRFFNKFWESRVQVIERIDQDQEIGFLLQKVV